MLATSWAATLLPIASTPNVRLHTPNLRLRRGGWRLRIVVVILLLTEFDLEFHILLRLRPHRGRLLLRVPAHAWC